MYQFYLAYAQCFANIIIIGPISTKEVYITLVVERKYTKFTQIYLKLEGIIISQMVYDAKEANARSPYNKD